MAADKATLVAYEKPALSPGDYVAEASQTLAVGNDTTQQWKTQQQFTVDTTPPYALPPEALHSFYPPRLQTVPAETLPHVVLNGSISWERPAVQSPLAAGETPLPWLALLLFAEEELVARPEFASYKQNASAAVQLPLNKVADAFPGRHPLPENPGPEVAQFIFLKSSIFKAYFMRQETPPGPDGKQPETKPQDHPDLARYKYLVHVNNTQGPSPTKVSVVLAHRVRAPVDGAAVMKVFAHLVSLERVGQINYPTDDKSDDVFPLISLHSWVYQWGAIPTKLEESGKDIFKSLQDKVRPLVLKLETPITITEAPEAPLTDEEKGAAADEEATSKWMRTRMEDGYTIVRYRSITGKISMAIYRGPLVPQPLSTRPVIHPSMYGTDLQILDAHTRVLDVSYSIAWDLGRSLAARTPQFSIPLARLRRDIILKATSRAENAPIVSPDAEQVTQNLVQQLEVLFGPGGLDGLKSAPAVGKSRWQSTTNPPQSTSIPPATMSAAKLIRSLKDCGKTWLEPAAESLAKEPTGTQDGVVGGMWEVISWIEKHIFTMVLTPALTMFPEPAAIAPEFISTFYIDDAWIDAVVDGALSVGNTMGGTQDAVRDVIRLAINKYISARPVADLHIARQGFILRSAFVEAFPGLSLDISQGTIVHQVRQEDMILCFFDPGPDLTEKTVDVTISQPPHQQCFGVTKLAAGQVTLTFDVNSFRKTQAEGASPQPAIDKMWDKDKPSTIPTVDEPIMDWATGILVPSTIVKASKAVAKEILKDEFQELSNDSESLYLAVHLQDRPSSLVIPFSIPPGRSSTTRQLFPNQFGDGTHGPATASPKGSAVTHTDPEGQSYLAKTVFALSFPGRNIPARSGPLIDLIFKVRGTDRAADRVSFMSLTFAIPIGEGAGDLLAPDTPTPSVKMVGIGREWICASYKSEAELTVQLRPRGTGVAGGPGLDASFQLMGCRVNGVPGRDAVIRSVEKFRDEVGEHEVKDAWAVAKE